MFISGQKPLLIDTKVNILAVYPSNGLTAYTTDTEEYLVANGTSWKFVGGEIINTELTQSNINAIAYSIALG